VGGVELGEEGRGGAEGGGAALELAAGGGFVGVEGEVDVVEEPLAEVGGEDGDGFGGHVVVEFFELGGRQEVFAVEVEFGGVHGEGGRG